MLQLNKILELILITLVCLNGCGPSKDEVYQKKVSEYLTKNSDSLGNYTFVQGQSKHLDSLVHYAPKVKSELQDLLATYKRKMKLTGEIESVGDGLIKEEELDKIKKMNEAAAVMDTIYLSELPGVYKKHNELDSVLDKSFKILEQDDSSLPFEVIEINASYEALKTRMKSEREDLKKALKNYGIELADLTKDGAVNYHLYRMQLKPEEGEQKPALGIFAEEKDELLKLVFTG